MGHGLFGYLIGLAVGYWIMTFADQQKNLTKTVGKVIAWVIIVVCLVGPICRSVCYWKCHHGAAQCSYSKECHDGDSKNGKTDEDKDKDEGAGK